MPRSSPKLALYASLLAAVSLATACDKDPLGTSPEAQADRIRANTPTELPPVTTEGAMTMGAYVETDTGRVLFVASGVERVDPIGSSSTDCDPFDAYRRDSGKFVVIRGWWCSRPEIGDPRQQSLALIRYDGGRSQLFYIIHEDTRSTKAVNYISDTLEVGEVEFIRNDSVNRVMSARFSATLYVDDGFDGGVNGDTIRIVDGRVDASYGFVP